MNNKLKANIDLVELTLNQRPMSLQQLTSATSLQAAEVLVCLSRLINSFDAFSYLVDGEEFFELRLGYSLLDYRVCFSK